MFGCTRLTCNQRSAVVSRARGDSQGEKTVHHVLALGMGDAREQLAR